MTIQFQNNYNSDDTVPQKLRGLNSQKFLVLQGQLARQMFELFDHDIYTDPWRRGLDPICSDHFTNAFRCITGDNT